jgi:hypothetical protein
MQMRAAALPKQKDLSYLSENLCCWGSSRQLLGQAVRISVGTMMNTFFSLFKKLFKFVSSKMHLMQIKIKQSPEK